MTSDSLPAMLDATLEPLNALHEQIHASLVLAQRMKLPGPYIETIKDAIRDLDAIWHNMNDIATVLDPDRAKHTD